MKLKNPVKKLQRAEFADSVFGCVCRLHSVVQNGSEPDDQQLRPEAAKPTCRQGMSHTHYQLCMAFYDPPDAGHGTIPGQKGMVIHKTKLKSIVLKQTSRYVLTRVRERGEEVKRLADSMKMNL